VQLLGVIRDAFAWIEAEDGWTFSEQQERGQYVLVHYDGGDSGHVWVLAEPQGRYLTVRVAPPSAQDLDASLEAAVPLVLRGQAAAATVTDATTEESWQEAIKEHSRTFRAGDGLTLASDTTLMRRARMALQTNPPE